MTDYLTELVNSSHNFRFLAEPALQLAGDAASAERFVWFDPDAAMARARRFTETLAKTVMQRTGTAPGPKDTHAKRIEKLANAGVLPARVQQLLGEIRTAGNNAVHSYDGDRQKAISIVEKCFEVGVWWYEFETGRSVAHTFTPPEPAETTSVTELLKGVENQMTQLLAAFEAGLDTGRRPEPRITIGPAAPDALHWQGGSRVKSGSVTYLVHEPVERTAADDGCWTLMRARAHGLDSRAGPVRLTGLLTGSTSAAATRMVDGMTAQASFLGSRGRRKGLPRLVSRHSDGALHTMVTAEPAGSTWAEMFGDGHQPLDPLIVPVALDALAAVADALTDLHRSGQAHRTLNGESILVTTNGRAGVLRDLGLAWWPRQRGEGGRYRGPEQQSIATGRPGLPTDVFQLAALLQHTCTGFQPAAGRPVPLRSFVPAVPERLDTLLVTALDPDPARRPQVDAFAAGLRLGRQQFLPGVTA